MTAAVTTTGSLGEFRARVLAARNWKEDDRLIDAHAAIAELEQEGGLRRAAVLVAVVERGGMAHMILTQRTEGLRSHSGQVAFPGGQVDPTDATPEAAALRETHEEIGVPPQAFEILGRMPDYFTGTGYAIAPVLAVARPDIRYRINPVEVAAAFEVPLSFLMNPRNHRQESGSWRGVELAYWSMPYGDRHIWGVTARIIRAIYERLYA